MTGMADGRDRIVSIQVDVEAALSKLTEYRNRLDELKDEEQKLKKARKEGTMTMEAANKALARNSAEIKSQKAAMQVLERQVINQRKANEAANGSLVQMRANLSNLTRAYDELSEAERNGEFGQKLQTQINEVTTALKRAEEETQRFYRNVGNYRGALESWADGFGGLFSKMKAVNAMFPTMGKGLAALKTGVAAFSKQLLALLANPIVATVAAITAAFLALKAIFDKMMDTIRGNERQYAQLQQVLAPLRVLGDQLAQVYSRLADVFLNVASAVMNAITRFTDFIGVTKNLTAETQRYINMERERRREISQSTAAAVQSARAQQEIARLQREAANENLTAAERQQKANEIEAAKKEQLKKEFQAAQDEYERVKADTAKSEEDKAKAQEAYIRAQTAFEEGWAAAEAERKRTTDDIKKGEEAAARAAEDAAKRTAAAAKSAADTKAREAKRAADEQARAEAERLRAIDAANDKEREILQKSEEQLIKLISDTYARRRAEINSAYDKEIADIQRRLQEEADLTAAARAGLQAQTVNLEKLRAAELDKVDVDAAKARAEEIAKIYEQETRDMKALFDARTAEARIAGESTLAVEVERKKAELDTLHQLETESDAEFYARKLQLQADYVDAMKNYNREEAEAQASVMEAQASVLGGLSGIMEAFGDESSSLARASKVVALAEIAINSGAALAKGIAAANDVSYPANLVAMATTVATILANIATAIKTVKGAKFAAGGLVTGAGTGTSDSIPARLSNGESVINAKSTEMFAPLLSQLNQAGGGVPIETVRGDGGLGEAMITRAVAAALGAMPRPVVSVEEITDVQSRVAAIEAGAAI